MYFSVLWSWLGAQKKPRGLGSGCSKHSACLAPDQGAFFCWHQFHVRIYRVKSAEGSEFLSPIMDQCWDDWGLSGGLGECRDGCVGWGGLARSVGCPESGWSRSLLTTHILFHSGDEPMLMAWTWPASRHQGCSLFRCHKPRTHPPPASLLKTHLSTRKASRVVTTNAHARPLYA